MAGMRAAGTHSGQGSMCLDARKPFSGVVGDTLKKSHRSASAPTPPTQIHHRDAKPCEVLPSAAQASHMVGGMPRLDSQTQRVCIPGYAGHVSGKVAENLHGGTFRSENERAATHTLPTREMRRTFSEPFRPATGLANTRGFDVAPRVPGYMGTIPGKMSETVHGMRFGEANEHAQMLRDFNPHVSSDGWLKRGRWPVDRLHTYKFNNRFVDTAEGYMFSKDQEIEAKAGNEDLGRTFGLHPPEPNPFKPGDRYLHSTFCKKRSRIDPSTQPPAGQKSISAILDGERWKMHNKLVISNGNQRTAY